MLQCPLRHYDHMDSWIPAFLWAKRVPINTTLIETHFDYDIYNIHNIYNIHTYTDCVTLYYGKL